MEQRTDIAVLDKLAAEIFLVGAERYSQTALIWQMSVIGDTACVHDLLQHQDTMPFFQRKSSRRQGPRGAICDSFKTSTEIPCGAKSAAASKAVLIMVPYVTRVRSSPVLKTGSVGHIVERAVAAS